MHKRDDYAAYRVFEPLWNLRLHRFDPEYVTFPLKWLNDTRLIDRLYLEHRKKRNVRSVFKTIYDDPKRLSALKGRIESCPITERYGRLFEEIVASYSASNYMVCAAALLPVIEGLIWSFSWWWNEKEGGLFDSTVTPDDFRAMSFRLLKPNGTPIAGRPNIGALLRQTRFGEEVYFEVVDYLVMELFEERNPVLHGRDPDYGTHEKAATLLFVAETLERAIMESVKRNLADNFEALLPLENFRKRKSA